MRNSTRVIGGVVASAALLGIAACGSDGDSGGSSIGGGAAGEAALWGSGVDGGSLSREEIKRQAANPNFSSTDQEFLGDVRAEDLLPSVATDMEILAIGHAVCPKLRKDEGNEPLSNLVWDLTMTGWDRRDVVSFLALSVASFCPQDYLSDNINNN